MENIEYVIIGLVILSIVTIIGIFKTKTAGFGRYTTSVLILALGLFISSFFFILGKIESSVFANIIFVVLGYAGGLISNKSET
jgi:hypothetical protein